jgi:hypothetical protein
MSDTLGLPPDDSPGGAGSRGEKETSFEADAPPGTDDDPGAGPTRTAGSDPMPPADVPTSIGRYRILGKLGDDD